MKEYITYKELRIIVLEKLKGKLCDNFDIKRDLKIADSTYYCTPLKDAQTIIAASKLHKRAFVRDIYDCDDFAHLLKSFFIENAYKDWQRRYPHCMGIVWGRLLKVKDKQKQGVHAINWMINDDKKLRFIEPQTDKIYYPQGKDSDISFLLI